MQLRASCIEAVDGKARMGTIQDTNGAKNETYSEYNSKIE